MIILATCLFGIALIAIITQRTRLARIDTLARSEEFRMRFSSLRHRIVLLGGSGKLTYKDKKALTYLYDATTVMLQSSAHYQQVAWAFCDAMLGEQLEARAEEPSSGQLEAQADEPPALRKQDVTYYTKPLLKELIDVASDLIVQFGTGWRLVVELPAAKPISERVRPALNLRAEQETLRRWRDVGARALDSYG